MFLLLRCSPMSKSTMFGIQRWSMNGRCVVIIYVYIQGFWPKTWSCTRTVAGYVPEQSAHKLPTSPIQP